MKVHIGGRDVTLIINYKKNKNTYFRFADYDKIIVNASKKQRVKDIKKYIYDNEKLFLKRLDRIKPEEEYNNGNTIFDEEYSIIYTDQKLAHVDHDLKVISIPNLKIDHKDSILKNIYKEVLLEKLSELQKKHSNNGLVDIDNIKFKTRYMTSRYGSCNPTRRTININLYLIHYPLQYLEYVFLHEITHLKVLNHSNKFYDLFNMLCPNYLQLRKELRKLYRHR